MFPLPSPSSPTPDVAYRVEYVCVYIEKAAQAVSFAAKLDIIFHSHISAFYNCYCDFNCDFLFIYIC